MSKPIPLGIQALALLFHLGVPLFIFTACITQSTVFWIIMHYTTVLGINSSRQVLKLPSALGTNFLRCFSFTVIVFKQCNIIFLTRRRDWDHIAKAVIMFLILAVLFCFFPFQKLIGDHFRVNAKKNGDHFGVGDHFRVGIISGSVQILLSLRAFSFQFLLFLILSFSFLLQASNSTFCTFPAFLCWNHSIAFLHPFLSFFHGFHFLELHFFSCSFLFLMALLFVAS